MLGPEAFAQTGYDYVGFDCQHGYLDDADVALLLKRLEHVPIATAVRLPSTAPAPIGRVLDAGADAIIVAMIETAEAGRRGGRRDAVRAARACAASGRCGPASATTSPRLESTGERATRWSRPPGVWPQSTRSARVPGLAGIYVGPADLAISMGHDSADAWRHPAVLDAMAHIVRPRHRRGLIAGVHAGDGDHRKHRRARWAFG